MQLNVSASWYCPALSLRDALSGAAVTELPGGAPRGAFELTPGGPGSGGNGPGATQTPVPGPHRPPAPMVDLALQLPAARVPGENVLRVGGGMAAPEGIGPTASASASFARPGALHAGEGDGLTSGLDLIGGITHMPDKPDSGRPEAQAEGQPPENDTPAYPQAAFPAVVADAPTANRHATGSAPPAATPGPVVTRPAPTAAPAAVLPAP
mgnify:CR=1 FL=1